MKFILRYILILLPLIVSAQNTTHTYKVSYDQYNNGEKSTNELNFIYSDQMVTLSKPFDKIQNYSDLKNKQNISTIVYENQLYKNLTPFSDLAQPSPGDNSDSILGYNSKYVSFSYFSNKIEVWYTEETTAKGSPSSRYIPNSNALVLKILINGSREIRINTIAKIEGYTPPAFLTQNAQQLSNAEFEEIKINSRYSRLQVFEDETINFDPSISLPDEDLLDINRTYHFSKGSVIMKKIKLTSELRESGYVFAKLNCKSNGDAYDRTGSVFIVPGSADLSVLNAYRYGLDKLPIYKDNNNTNYQGIIKEGSYLPPIEIIRFFTSFGANHFNEKRKINNYDWATDVLYEQEISSLIPSDEEEIWVGVFIGNYDKGGHKVSLEFNFYPAFEGENAIDTKYIQPLFSTVNTLEMSGQNYGRLFNNDTLRVSFEINESIDNLQLLFVTTGHGGWGGGDEFNPKLNQLFIDGKEVFKVIPWRTDCATYRLSNPASGNFANGLSSSDFSRSNWCPATLTNPYIIPLKKLKPGKHHLELVIDQGKDEGNSFNHWSATGVLTGEIRK